jgi:putative transposase
LTKTKSKVVIEDLNVSGMMKNRKLSRAISDLGLFEFRRQLEYKGKWYGCEIDIADRFFPSSKKCSSCGNIKQDLTLADRVYNCLVCGLEIDRDVNASCNLRDYTIKSTVSSTGINAFGDGSSGLLL